MPRKIDPKQVISGSGLAGSQSVGADALLFDAAIKSSEPDPALFDLTEDIIDLRGRVEVNEDANADTQWLRDSERAMFYQLADGGTIEWEGTLAEGGAGRLALDGASLLVVLGVTPTEASTRGPEWYDGAGTRFPTIYKRLQVVGLNPGEVFDVRSKVFEYEYSQVKIRVVDGSVAGAVPEVDQTSITNPATGAVIGALVTVTFDSAQSHTIQDVVDAIVGSGSILTAQLGVGNGALPAFEYAERELVGGQDGVFYEITEAELASTVVLTEGSILAIQFDSIEHRKQHIEENSNQHLIPGERLVVLGKGNNYTIDAEDYEIEDLIPNMHVIGRVIDDKFVFSNGLTLYKAWPQDNVAMDASLNLLSTGLAGMGEAYVIPDGHLFDLLGVQAPFLQSTGVSSTGTSVSPRHWETNGEYFAGWSANLALDIQLIIIGGPLTAQIFTIPAGLGVIARLALSDDKVVFIGAGGAVNAYWLVDGTLAWSTSFDGAPPPLDIVPLSMASDGTDFYIVGDSSATSYTHMKISGEDGTVIWQHDRGGAYPLWDVAFASGRLVVGGVPNASDEMVHILEANTGNVISSWAPPPGGTKVGRRHLAADPYYIYASVEDDGLYVLDWEFATATATTLVTTGIDSEVKVDDNFLYQNTSNFLFVYPKSQLRSFGTEVGSTPADLYRLIRLNPDPPEAIQGFASNGTLLLVGTEGDTVGYPVFNGAKRYMKRRATGARPAPWIIFPTSWSP